MNYLSANKTKLTGALLVAFGVLQTQSEQIRALLTPNVFAWFTIVVGVVVAVLGFLNSGGSITPPGEKQGGFARPLQLFFLAVLATFAAGLVVGCAGTRSAYQAADTAEEYAYVVTEHYAAVLAQAVALRANPAVPRDAIAAIQRADLKVAPAILALAPLRQALKAVKSAENEAALQAAVDAAVRALAELVREVKAATASPAAWRHLEQERPAPLVLA